MTSDICLEAQGLLGTELQTHEHTSVATSHKAARGHTQRRIQVSHLRHSAAFSLVHQLVERGEVRDLGQR